MDRKTRFSPPAVGGSSLLVIFAVLCLTVFALLGLSTVQAGERLSQVTVQGVSAYYEADCQAEEIFARLHAGELPEGVTAEGGLYAYTCPISDTQQLRVEVYFDGTEWSVLRWQAESTTQWEEGSGTLDLWDGTTF